MHSLKVLKTEKISKQALRTLFHIEWAQTFKKGQLQCRLKQLSLEQNPGHNTR